jgi:hypothetical protein
VVPVKPDAIVETVFRLALSPFFNKMVTAPEASVHVRFAARSAGTLTKNEAGIVNLAALVSAKTAAPTRTLENCMLKKVGLSNEGDELSLKKYFS